MPKTIKHYKKRKKPIKFNPDGSTKSGIWNKELSTGQQVLFYIIAFILIIAIILTICYFIGKQKLDNQGYETSDLVVENYFNALTKHDSSAMRNCFSLYSRNNEFDYKLNVTESDNFKNTELIKDSISIESSAFDTTDIINNLRNPYISNANVIYANFKTNETTDTLNCQQLYYYKLITYEFDSKWYIYAAQKIKEITESASQKKTSQTIDIFEGSEIDLTDTKKVGSKETGYICIGNDWTEQTTPDENNEKLNSIKSYVSPDSNAVITMATTNAYADLQTATEFVIEKLIEKSKGTLSREDMAKVDSTFCSKYTCTQIFYISSETNQHNMTWIFLDGNIIRYISFDYLAPKTSCANYINTFTTA